MINIGDEFTKETKYASEEFVVTDISNKKVVARSLYGGHSETFSFYSLKHGTKDFWVHFYKKADVNIKVPKFESRTGYTKDKKQIVIVTKKR